MEKYLKTYFGFEDFRPGQREIIKNVLDGGDSLVLMSTGGGKSLCFQLPALKLPGLTLVISPLISLMKDQVDALKANGIGADFINSSLLGAEIAKRQEAARQGETKIIYLAPERLAMPAFQDFLKTLEVSLIAIDEAHCISEWGHDFRPDYRNLIKLREQFKEVPVIALTATATPKVRQDIAVQLGLKGAKLFQTGFNRPNLNYIVRPKRKAFDGLVSLLKEHKNSSAIIYCFSRKETEELAEDLRAEGFSVLAYHAGLEGNVRKETQNKFIRDEINIIAATIAFGMGIDKPDVRLVVHYSLPKSIEGYYQETGRAGRDGLKSDCVLFYNYGDTIKHNYFIKEMEDENEKANARQKLSEMVEYCELNTCRRAFLLSYFGDLSQPNKHPASPVKADPGKAENLDSFKRVYSDSNCGGCDVCFNPREEFDGTVIAQKVLSAVIRTGERFGANYIIAVLKGSGNKKILENNHDRLSVYGIVDDFSLDELKQITRDLIARGFILKSPGEYPTLSLSRAGKDFLSMRKKINLIKPTIEKETKAVKREEELDYDRELFEKLRVQRKWIADERGVPPFVIFSDATLIQMAYYLPQSLESFARISGVGERKLAEWGKIFTDLILKYSRECGLSEREIPAARSGLERRTSRKSSTYAETRKYIKEKLPLKEIAAKRGLTASTIVGHMEKLILAGEEFDIEYMRPSALRFEKIKTAFAESGGAMLAPVREILGEDFSYDELRFARLFL
ncbi:DNA helicase RecQ [Candidatus Falkowbacteria bacterium]|nr:MAG: DNA helicase RecQ [Candidatus Falkowbacteria bacterium]